MGQKPRLLISLDYLIENVLSKKRDFEQFNPRLFEKVCKEVGAYYEGGYCDFDKANQFIEEYVIQAEASATGKERILTNAYDLSGIKEQSDAQAEQHGIDIRRLVQQNAASENVVSEKSDRLSQDDIDELLKAESMQKAMIRVNGSQTTEPEKRQATVSKTMNYVTNLGFAIDLLKNSHRMPYTQFLLYAFRAFCHYDGVEANFDAINNVQELLPREYIESAVTQFCKKIDKFCTDNEFALLRDKKFEITDKYVDELCTAFMRTYI